MRSTKLFPNAPELTPDITGSPPLTPMRMTPRPPVHSEEAGSDTHSIRSARSVTSLAAAAIRHPDLTEPGLSASIVETVSISFEAGLPTKSLVAGEIAFAYHAHAGAADEQSLTIRMDNFVILEKVAPNPAFVSAIPDRDGEYTVLPQNIRGTAVAFKYQVHLDDVSPPIYAPIIITPVWRLEPHQSSVIINWRPNPDYRRLNGSTKPITLHNVVFVVGIEGANTSSCQSKPMGTFSRERGRIAWKLGDLVIDPEQINGGSKVLARFATDGLAKSTPVEVRWEILGEDADCVGSGLTLSALTASAKEEEADPFADTTGEDKSINGVPEATGIGAWAPLAGAKKVASGKYIAS